MNSTAPQITLAVFRSELHSILSLIPLGSPYFLHEARDALEEFLAETQGILGINDRLSFKLRFCKTENTLKIEWHPESRKRLEVALGAA